MLASCELQKASSFAKRICFAKFSRGEGYLKVIAVRLVAYRADHLRRCYQIQGTRSQAFACGTIEQCQIKAFTTFVLPCAVAVTVYHMQRVVTITSDAAASRSLKVRVLLVKSQWQPTLPLY